MTTKLKGLVPLVIGLFVLMVSYAGVAYAAGVAEPADGSLLDYLKPVYEAFASGNKLYAGALALVAACALLKRYAPGKLGTWLGTDVGGSLMALATSFFGAIATALASGNTPFSLSLVWTAAHIAAIAAGGYAILKKLAYDPLIASAWYQTKAPAWLKTAVGLIGWIFEDSPAVAAAKAAGDAAVAAAPAPGAVATTGAPTEVK